MSGILTIMKRISAFKLRFCNKLLNQMANAKCCKRWPGLVVEKIWQFYNLLHALEKTTEHLLKFLFFYLKVQSFGLIMENNFIQMAASAGHAVAYTIGPIFKQLCAAVFPQWLHEYCPLKRQLYLACRPNTYL